MFKNLLQFIREAIEELKKVSWLSRQQMIQSTWVVILLVIICAIYVGALDFIIATVFGLLIKGQLS